MDSYLDLSRLLHMDPQNQMRPPAYTDAYSRYMPTMPTLATGGGFPFLSGMYSAPTSPFRSPSTPGGRQFWPPTPPPDGSYGRALSLNTNLFPLLAPPTDNGGGAFLTQAGLVSRHLSSAPLIDPKDHSFFSGIGLASPLTPNSHVTSPSYPHLIPSLERHYSGHMTLGGDDINPVTTTTASLDDIKLSHHHHHHHGDCGMKQHDIPSSRQHDSHNRAKSKSENVVVKHCCIDSKAADDGCCKLSSSHGCVIPYGGKMDDIRNHSKQVENKHNHNHNKTRIQPCKIEVSHSPGITLPKPDLLSPPIESPKSEQQMASPSKNSSRTLRTSEVTRCSQCCASCKAVASVVTTKLDNDGKDSPVVTAATSASQPETQNNTGCVNNQRLKIQIATTTGAVECGNQQEGGIESQSSCEKESGSSPVITITDVSDKPTTPPDASFSKQNVESSSKPVSCATVPLKHVTAAVIPTAPRVLHRPDIVHPTSTEVAGNGDHQPSFLRDSPQKSSSSSDGCVKVELADSSSTIGCTLSSINRSLGKNLTTSCKVKDMIKSAKQIDTKVGLDVSLSSKNNTNAEELDNSQILNVVSTTNTPVNPMIVTSKTNITKPLIMEVAAKKSNSDDSPSFKMEMAQHSRSDCEFTTAPQKWTKATVSPFSWTQDDSQAINLTVSRKGPVKPEPTLVNNNAETAVVAPSVTKPLTTDNTVSSSSSGGGVIGVCHPNPIVKQMGKVQPAPVAAISSSNFASVTLVNNNQPVVDQSSTEVHILHRSSKSSSSFPLLNRSSPVPIKGTISHLNTIHHRSLKTERLLTTTTTTKRKDQPQGVDKGQRTTTTTALATLAPKLTKNFGKDIQTSHTISASSSVSSTSIVFPATVNPCIPVGIAIAQQRQDTSTTASMGKDMKFLLIF